MIHIKSEPGIKITQEQDSNRQPMTYLNCQKSNLWVPETQGHRPHPNRHMSLKQWTGTLTSHITRSSTYVPANSTFHCSATGPYIVTQVTKIQDLQFTGLSTFKHASYKTTGAWKHH